MPSRTARRPAGGTAAQVDGRAARWAGHREARRAAFVDAAITVIEREGAGATVDQISAELGVTRQALYRQFADRADLDRAIAARAAGNLVEDLLPHLDLSGGDPPADVASSIRGALGAYLDYIEAHLELYRFVRAHDTELPRPDGASRGGSAVRHVKDTVAGRVADAATGLLAAGSDSADAGRILAAGLVGMADAVISGWLEQPGRTSRTQLIDQLTLMMTAAVSAVPPAG